MKNSFCYPALLTWMRFVLQFKGRELVTQGGGVGHLEEVLTSLAALPSEGIGVISLGPSG